jgi:hypothetical protein
LVTWWLNNEKTMRIHHPYQNLTGGSWLRGNLHMHTTASDGSRPLQAVIDDYAARKYDFLMISDHDILSDAKTYSAADAKGMTLLPGNEISAAGPHLLHIGANVRITPHAQRQQILTDIAAAGGIAVINHPNWHGNFNHCSIEQLKEWVGYVGIEIYNGVISRLDGSPYATNKWDMLLATGRQVWGFANDDSHAAEGDVELGWNMVYTPDRKPASIINAMRDGQFYPSTGVTIRSIAVNGDTIRIETDNARRIVALQQVGKRFATADGNAIEVQVPASATYVRFECWGDGEKFAWTQPFFIEK